MWVCLRVLVTTLSNRFPPAYSQASGLLHLFHHFCMAFCAVSFISWSVSYNNITSVPPNAFSDLSKLQFLLVLGLAARHRRFCGKFWYISYNGVKSIEPNAFTGLTSLASLQCCEQLPSCPVALMHLNTSVTTASLSSLLVHSQGSDL